MALLNKEQIKEIIPYDEPFLFVDGVEEIGETNISGFYQTSKEAPYFKGHFVDFKIMPGVLVVEALAQLSTILLRQKFGENHKKCHFLAYEVRGVQFLKPIFPEDKIILKDEILGIYQNQIAHIKGQALVGEELKCEARFSVAIVDKDEFKTKYLEEKAAKYNLQPVALGLFGGVYDFNKMSWFFRKTMSAVKPKLEEAGFKETEPGVYDTRDLNAIRSWAKQVAQTVQS